jgi:anti-sigma regulatory factor (Ser/Thr protein kinase)
VNDGNSPRTRDIEWLLSRHPRSVGLARALLRETARAWQIPQDTTDTAVLLLSELMTNACRHARVPAGRKVSAHAVLLDGTLRIEVSDASNEMPKARLASDDDESGRGLALVEALADSWDVRPRPYGIGKTVWFTLRIPAPPKPSPPPNPLTVTSDSSDSSDSSERMRSKSAIQLR